LLQDVIRELAAAGLDCGQYCYRRGSLSSASPYSYGAQTMSSLAFARQGARGFITAFARNLVVTRSTPLGHFWLTCVASLGVARPGFSPNSPCLKWPSATISLMSHPPFSSKVCPVCGIDKPRSEYYKKLNTISHKCKPCTLVDSHNRHPKYVGKYVERQNTWRKNRYANDPEYRDRIAAQKKAIYEQRKEEINQARRDRWANDPMNPARKYNRRKDVKDRTPKWVDNNEILLIYAFCPKGHDVDHIIPLRGLIDGRPVTGLHVPWNLQYLTSTENRKKKNRISEKDIEGIFLG